EARPASRSAPESTEARLRSSGLGSPPTSNPARSARARPNPPAEDLPVILQTDDLPPAPEDEDEAGDHLAAEGGARARSGGSAGAAAGSSHSSALASERSANSAAKSDPKSRSKAEARSNARPEPAAHAATAIPKANAASRRETAPRNAKHLSA